MLVLTTVKWKYVAKAAEEGTCNAGEGSSVVRMHRLCSALAFVSATRVEPQRMAVPAGGVVVLGARVRSAESPPLVFSSVSTAKRGS